MRKDIDKCQENAGILEKYDELSGKVEGLATRVQHIERDYNKTQISRYQVLVGYSLLLTHASAYVEFCMLSRMNIRYGLVSHLFISLFCYGSM